MSRRDGLKPRRRAFPDCDRRTALSLSTTATHILFSPRFTLILLLPPSTPSSPSSAARTCRNLIIATIPYKVCLELHLELRASAAACALLHEVCTPPPTSAARASIRCTRPLTLAPNRTCGDPAAARLASFASRVERGRPLPGWLRQKRMTDTGLPFHWTVPETWPCHALALYP